MNVILASHCCWFFSVRFVLLQCETASLFGVECSKVFSFGFESIDCGVAFVSDIVWQTLTNLHIPFVLMENTLGSLFYVPWLKSFELYMRTWRRKSVACVCVAKRTLLYNWHVSTLAISMKSFAKTFHAHTLITHLMLFFVDAFTIGIGLGRGHYFQLILHKRWQSVRLKLTTLCISRNCFLIFHLFVPRIISVCGRH